MEEIKLYDTAGREVALTLNAMQGAIEVVLPPGMSVGPYLLIVKDEPLVVQIY